MVVQMFARKLTLFDAVFLTSFSAGLLASTAASAGCASSDIAVTDLITSANCQAFASGANAVAVGTGAFASGANQTTIGYNAGPTQASTGATSIGYEANLLSTAGTSSVAVGASTASQGNYSV